MSSSFVGRMRLSDSAGRILFLNAAVVVEKGFGVRINITAPYWIINKTGLPLVFRQEGVGLEAAGQFEEHEKARMVAPLLFSFSDEEASRTLAVRVGTGLHPNGVAQWSQPFHLHLGVQVWMEVILSYFLVILVKQFIPAIYLPAGPSTESNYARWQARRCLSHWRCYSRCERKIQTYYSCHSVTEISIAQPLVVYVRIGPEMLHHHSGESKQKF